VWLVWRAIVINAIPHQAYTKHVFNDLAKLAGVPKVK